MEKRKRKCFSVHPDNGNLVSLGKFDAKGVNGKRWNPDNRDGNLGVSLSRSVTKLAYLNSIANVKVKEMAEKLAGLIKDVVANYDKF
jgi:hypothetical protein